MPLDAVENRYLDAVLAALATIGTPPSGWNTVPAAAEEGFPGEAVTVAEPPLLFVESSRTDPLPSYNSSSAHGVTIAVNVWLCAKDARTLNKLKSDVCRCVMAREGIIAAAFQTPAYVGPYMLRPDLSNAGVSVGQMTVILDTSHLHTDP